jgi:hypothetical protein
MPEVYTAVRRGPSQNLIDDVAHKKVICIESLACSPRRLSRANEASGAASMSRRDDPREATRAEHQWVHAISASQLPEGHRRTVVVDGHTIVLFNSRGRPFVVDNRCPQMGFPLGGYDLDNFHRIHVLEPSHRLHDM